MEAMIVNEKLLKYPASKISRIKGNGEIPKHWAISKLKYIAQIYNGDSLNEQQKKAFEDPIPSSRPYIATKDIDFERSQIDYNNGLRVPQKDNSLKIAPKNSSLMCIE
jgi:type I restriction enzyme, S subunit